MSLTRRHPTPPSFRAIPRWQAHPEVVRFAPHQQLRGCLWMLLVYAAVVVALPMLLWALTVWVGGSVEMPR